MQDEKTVDRLRVLSEILDPRYLRLEQALTIYSLLCRYHKPPTRILEVGTYCGTGAILLGAMVEPWGGKVTTVDLPWTGQPNEHFQKTADDWIRDLEVKNVEVVRRPDGAEGWFLDHFKSKRPSLDFCYIDGGHKWLNNRAQFVMALAAIHHGAWICFDDIESSAWPEVGQTWRDVVCSLIPKGDRFTVEQLGFVMRRDRVAH